MGKNQIKLLGIAAAAIVLLIVGIIINPFSVNDGSERTVVQRYGGKQFVRFQPGAFYAGFFATETSWPNQLSVTYMDSIPDLSIKDNGIEIGYINIMFSDGMTADIKGVAQFILPTDEPTMLAMHNVHKSPQSLVQKRLLTFTKECMQSSAQLMTSDKHYGGGRTQMSQDFLDQLRNGVFLANVGEKTYYDSVAQESKKIYLAEIKKDKNGLPLRKSSPLTEYNITVADGSAYDARYEKKFYTKLEKIIEASTSAAVSRQNYMTAQQEALTSKAQGEKKLIDIEYQQKQQQTIEVVQAETKVKVAEQDKLQQKIAYEAALIEVKKRAALADVAAYEKKTTLQADGALEMKAKLWLEGQKVWADAFGKYTGNIVPMIGGWSVNGGNGAVNFMEVMTMKAAKDLALDMKVKGN